MKHKFLLNLSANTLQLIVNQLCGFAVFYLLSTQLSKANFGLLNLVLAILLISFNLLTLGIDQVIIKKIAGGYNLQKLLSLYLFHVLLTGFLFYTMLLLAIQLLAANHALYLLLLVIGTGKLLIYFSSPFKTLANGLEKFKLLAIMLVVSNLARSVGLLILLAFRQITLTETIIAFVTGDLLELLVCTYLFKRQLKIPVLFNWDKKAYIELLSEALPQTGVVILTAIMARFDWIFIGIFISALKLAEYSFAYKIFEISSLPLLAIAPLLLPWFTKLIKTGLSFTEKFKTLVNIELIIASITMLTLNLLWEPVVDFVTAGKYGAVNSKTIFILSCAIPFLYLNNFFWTLNFAQGRTKMILKGFMLTFSINASLDIMLIPFFGNEGAALALLISSMAQTYFYFTQNEIDALNSIWRKLIIYIGCTFFAGFTAIMCFSNPYLLLSFALLLYFLLMLVMGQLKISNYLAFLKTNLK
ncbi:MAG: oligosaccharide flippase family protein [Bacteroidota bacterium]